MVQPSHRRLVTEDRLTTSLASKANTGHQHAVTDITNLAELIPLTSAWRPLPVTAGDGSNGFFFDGTGTAEFKRFGPQVVIRFKEVGVLPDFAGAGYLTPAEWLPTGARNWQQDLSPKNLSNGTGTVAYSVGVWQRHRLAVFIGTTKPGTGNDALNGQIQYYTDDAFPSAWVV